MVYDTTAPNAYTNAITQIGGIQSRIIVPNRRNPVTYNRSTQPSIRLQCRAKPADSRYLSAFISGRNEVTPCVFKRWRFSRYAVRTHDTCAHTRRRLTTEPRRNRPASASSRSRPGRFAVVRWTGLLHRLSGNLGRVGHSRCPVVPLALLGRHHRFRLRVPSGSRSHKSDTPTCRPPCIIEPHSSQKCIGNESTHLSDIGI